ncbi:MAG: PepSY-associated TM helix domain-containing protein [Hyphomonadaceae bacterium]
MAMMFWKRQARTWHWMSGAISLIGMLLFAVTGITLNHAADIPASLKARTVEAVLPPDLIAQLAAEPEEGATPELPELVRRHLESDLNVSLKNRQVEWTDIDAYIDLPRPGGDAYLTLDRESGEAVLESTSRGAISYLNDLHKGRNTGVAWSWFLDIFAVAAIVFCLTGLWLLQMHASARRSTWALVAGGLALPVILLIVFVHA